MSTKVSPSVPKSRIVADLVRVADVFCAASGVSRAFVSKELFGRGGQIDYLAGGRRDLNTRSAERAIEWLSDHWPSGLDWPAGIARPDKFQRAAAGDDFHGAASQAAAGAGPGDFAPGPAELAQEAAE